MQDSARTRHAQQHERNKITQKFELKSTSWSAFTEMYLTVKNHAHFPVSPYQPHFKIGKTFRFKEAAGIQFERVPVAIKHGRGL